MTSFRRSEIHSGEPTALPLAGRYHSCHELKANDPNYPPNLLQSDQVEFPTLYGLGDPSILRRHCIGILCSVTCPGSVIIKTFDVIREIRDAGVTVAGGFHSPMERECLDFLLCGKEPTILCMSRHPRRAGLPKRWQAAIDNSTLFLLSPFGPTTRRTSRATSYRTNLLVAHLSRAIVVPYASPLGMTAEIATKCLAKGMKILTFPDTENSDLRRRGASIYDIASVKEMMK